MFLDDRWIEGFGGRVPRPLPGVAQRSELIRHCSGADRHAKLLLYGLAEQWAIPETVFLQFLVEKLLYFGRELGGAWLGCLIRQAYQAVLLEAVKIVVDRLVVAIKMFSELLHGHSCAMQAKDTGSQSHFRVTVGIQLKFA